jgi:hypothetical protein
MKTDNELIAEFMGFTFSHERGDKVYNVPIGEHLKYKAFKLSLVKMNYHTSWDWLIPVVEKIEELYSKAFPPGDKFIQMIMDKENPIDHHYMDVVAIPLSTPIEEAYKAIVEFIKWYNSQLNP